ncbi:hypothetical protein GMB80_14485 [Turicibacter sanguinis]|nr:hypothetical protein [Turicibacter sanguinis]
MNGLEAIELMKQGKIVTDRKRKYKISDGKITVLTYVVRNDMGTERELWENVEYFNTAKDSYEEYIEPKPLTGWERVDEERSYYYIDGLVNVKKTFEANHEIDETVYEKANYFSTKEKAEEINFKQTLFRKLQRFSDENGGNEIDWNNSRKYFIEYYSKGEKLAVDYAYRLYNFGQVYFASREIAEKAIELFHDELIKYFTGDFGGEA